MSQDTCAICKLRKRGCPGRIGTSKSNPFEGPIKIRKRGYPAQNPQLSYQGIWQYHVALPLQWARSLQIVFLGFAKKCPKNVSGVISGGRQGSPAKCPKNVKKMSWGPAGVQPGFGKMSKKRQQKCPQTFSGHFFDILKPFW